jgi:hypothetical protein
MKHIYSSDGRYSAPVPVMYFVLIIAAPVVLGWTMLREIGGGLRQGYLECRVELEELKRILKSAR